MSASQRARKPKPKPKTPKVSRTAKAASKPLARKPGRAASARKAASSPVRVKIVRSKLGLKQTQMSRILGISARKLSELESQSKDPRPETNRRLTEVDRLRKGLEEIMDAENIAPWMETPNNAFDGSTPLQLIERGEIDRIWQMIFAVRTGHPL